MCQCQQCPLPMSTMCPLPMSYCPCPGAKAGPPGRPLGQVALEGREDLEEALGEVPRCLADVLQKPPGARSLKGPFFVAARTLPNRYRCTWIMQDSQTSPNGQESQMVFPKGSRRRTAQGLTLTISARARWRICRCNSHCFLSGLDLDCQLSDTSLLHRKVLKRQLVSHARPQTPTSYDLAISIQALGRTSSSPHSSTASI